MYRMTSQNRLPSNLGLRVPAGLLHPVPKQTNVSGQNADVPKVQGERSKQLEAEMPGRFFGAPELLSLCGERSVARYASRGLRRTPHAFTQKLATRPRSEPSESYNNNAPLKREVEFTGARVVEQPLRPTILTMA